MASYSTGEVTKIPQGPRVVNKPRVGRPIAERSGCEGGAELFLPLPVCT